MAYTNAQIQALWIKYGGNPAAAPMAASIALAESSGDPNNTNHNTNGTTDRGLFQINSIWGGLSSYDLVTNIKGAIQISHNGSNWGPWSTFNNGAYRKYLTGAQTAALPAGTGTAPASTPTASAPSAGAAGSDLFGAHHSQLLYAAVWVGAALTAVWLLGLGVNRATHGAPARAATRAVGTAAKVAAA